MLAPYEPTPYGFSAENRLASPNSYDPSGGSGGGGYGGFGASYQPQQSQQPQPWSQQPAWGQPQAGTFGGGMPFFDDPLTQPIMSAWTGRMSQLARPGPDYGEAEDYLRASAREDPRLSGLIKTLTGLTTRSAPGNAYLGQYAGATQKRMKELNEDPFSGSDEAALKARFFDDLARDRDDRHQQLRERLAGMGMAPTSGTAQEAATLLEGEYEGARASQQRDLLKYVTDERNRRRDLAVEMSGGLSGHGQADASNRAQWMAQQANIGQGLAGLLASLQANKAGVGQSLAGLKRTAYGDDLERGGALLETSALPATMWQQRMAQMAQLLQGQGTPQSLYEQQLAQQKLADENKRYSDQNKANIFGTIGGVAAPILGAAAKSWFD
jgi:hypothetical protein